MRNVPANLPAESVPWQRSIERRIELLSKRSLAVQSAGQGQIAQAANLASVVQQAYSQISLIERPKLFVQSNTLSWTFANTSTQYDLSTTFTVPAGSNTVTVYLCLNNGAYPVTTVNSNPTVTVTPYFGAIQFKPMYANWYLSAAQTLDVTGMSSVTVGVKYQATDMFSLGTQNKAGARIDVLAYFHNIDIPVQDGP